MPRALINVKNIECHRKLRKMCNEHQTDWDELIHAVLYSMIVERLTSTRFSPFEVMFGGRPAKFKGEVTEVIMTLSKRMIY